jgi:hypothetical protein
VGTVTVTSTPYPDGSGNTPPISCSALSCPTGTSLQPDSTGVISCQASVGYCGPNSVVGADGVCTPFTQCPRTQSLVYDATQGKYQCKTQKGYCGDGYIANMISQQCEKKPECTTGNLTINPTTGTVTCVQDAQGTCPATEYLDSNGKCATKPPGDGTIGAECPQPPPPKVIEFSVFRFFLFILMAILAAVFFKNEKYKEITIFGLILVMILYAVLVVLNI